MDPRLSLILLLAPVVLAIVAADPVSSNDTKKLHEFRYTKEGNLEVSFKSEDYQNFESRKFKPTLFFKEEKENRQVFNMDICVNFKESNGTNPQPSAEVVVCYKGQLMEKEVPKPKDDIPMKTKGELGRIKTQCTQHGRANMRGFKIIFKPPIYEFYSMVDQNGYQMNASEFSEDEIKVYRKNQMAKYCLRLEMGRMPPDSGNVYDEQARIQDAVRYLLFDSEATNKTDNVTELLKEAQLIMTVEDVTQEVRLMTIDLEDHPDAYAFGAQKDRPSKRLLGLIGNKTEDKLPLENRTHEYWKSSLFYKDFMPKLKTDKNYKMPTWTDLEEFELKFIGAEFLNFSFNSGNIFPCRTEWVDLEKFQMERDYYHPEINKFFKPIHIAYTVGLVGWKDVEEQGFGPGYEKKGRFGPSDEEIEELKKVLPKTQGFLDMEKRYIVKFGDTKMLPNETFHKLEDYYTPLQLNAQKPLGEITVKQLVFVCADHTFNLPHVASFVDGIGM